MRQNTITLKKRKKYRTSNIVPLDMVVPRDANEISEYLSQYLNGITPRLVLRLLSAGVISPSQFSKKMSCYLFASDYVEELQMREDEKKKRIKELEKKHGRF